MPLTGGCLCNGVRYAVDAPLVTARCCHCSRCRKAFGGAGSAYAEIEPGSFRWTAGEERVVRYEPRAGWALHFCGTCGSALCASLGDAVHGITLGSVDGDPGIDVAMHIFVDSRAPWDHVGGDAPRYPEGPPASSP